jgi:hypothetical protein
LETAADKFSYSSDSSDPMEEVPYAHEEKASQENDQKEVVV